MVVIEIIDIPFNGYKKERIINIISKYFPKWFASTLFESK